MAAELPTLSEARLKTPAGTQPVRVSWVDAIGLAFCHLVACLAFLPWLFSWTGLAVAVAGLYVFGALGIGLCFHRLLTHRGMVCPKALEHAFAILGVCCLQDTPARWVAIHRRHHMHADEQQDPHSPLVNFLWAHVGWLIFKNKDLTRLNVCTCYAKDILRDPFYARLERKQVWVAIVLGSWAAFFATGFVIELLVGGSFMNALKFGLSLLIWGVFVRTVLVWHSTWAVNSVAHVWGYRNYDTAESSRNNVIVALLSGGEGWHNNHHAFPRSARHGHMWWELDVTWLTIRILGYLGLAQCLVLPKGKRLNSSGGDG